MKGRLIGAAMSVALAALAIAGVAVAGPQPSVSHAKAIQGGRQELAVLTRVVESSSHNPNVSVASVFAGPSGLTGMVLRQPGSPDSIAWITADRKVVIPGAIYDAAGSDLTKGAMYTAGIFIAPARVLREAAAPAARPIMDGHAGPVLTFLLDPNCIYCHLFYNAIQPYVQRGKIKVRYVMVGVVKPSSLARASAILSAADPLKAIATNESAFDVKHEEGGYPAAGGESAAASVVQANNELMRRAGSSGTPTLLFCSGGEVRMQPGVPDDIAAWLASLGASAAPECR